ncbi:MAG: ferritin family protein [Vicinamibacterales bacterium]
MTRREAILDILSRAYQIEVDGYTFYSMTAERAEEPAVQELFAKLASDEAQHQAFLKSIAGDYDEKGQAAFALGLKPPEANALASKVFTGRFREQVAGAQFALGVVSIGMTLEANAIRCFTEAAVNATEREIKDFYTFLTNWEKQHYEALQEIFTLVRADHMAESRFAPY